MFGNFSAQAGVIANNINSSPNIISPELTWNFNDVLVMDFLPLGVSNINDRPRINVWKTINGIPIPEYTIYISGGRNVLSPSPTGNIIQPWGDRRTGEYIFPKTSIIEGGLSEYYSRQIITGINGQIFDYFGGSIDANSDGSVIVVGANGDNISIPGIIQAFGGSVSIFTGNINNGWNFSQLLTGEYFGNNLASSYGRSVAINDQGNIIVIGGSDSHRSSGSIIIFTGNQNNGWMVKQIITGNSNNSTFGFSLDTNNDASVIIVGAPFQSIGGKKSKW